MSDEFEDLDSMTEEELERQTAPSTPATTVDVDKDSDITVDDLDDNLDSPSTPTTTPTVDDDLDDPSDIEDEGETIDDDDLDKEGEQSEGMSDTLKMIDPISEDIPKLIIHQEDSYFHYPYRPVKYCNSLTRGEFCFKRPQMPKGFVDEEKITSDFADAYKD